MPRSLRGVLAQAAERVAPDMNAREVGNTLNAYAKLDEAVAEMSRPLRDAPAEAAERVAPDMSAQNVANTLNAYAMLLQGFSQCLNGEKFGFIVCPRCQVTMMHAKALTNHQAGAGGGDNVTFCLSYQEAAAAVADGTMIAHQVASRRHMRMAAF